MIITVGDHEELTQEQTAFWLGIGQQTFSAEVNANLWEGCYRKRGTEKRFVPVLIRQRQVEMAAKIAEYNREHPAEAHAKRKN